MVADWYLPSDWRNPRASTLAVTPRNGYFIREILVRPSAGQGAAADRRGETAPRMGAETLVIQGKTHVEINHTFFQPNHRRL
jgi:hypothetical protein